MSINKKIKTLSDLCIGDKVIDIGCDHGYLLIDLANTKRLSQGLGVEITEGPMRAAIKNIEKNELDEIVKIKKSDGLREISFEEVREFDNIVIAGMGGELIQKIIEQDFSKFTGDFQLILQPNSKEKSLREFLVDNKFLITNEVIVEENGKLYEVFVAKYDKEFVDSYTESDLLFGKFFNRNELAMKKWEQELETLEAIVTKLKDSNHEVPKDINEKIKLINQKMRESKRL